MSLKDNIITGNATLDDQEEALKDSYCAYLFAERVPGADIDRCQEVACKNLYFALIFARDIPGANVEKCQEAACKDPEWAYRFARFIPEADIKKSLEACKGTGWEDKLNKALMERALR